MPLFMRNWNKQFFRVFIISAIFFSFLIFVNSHKKTAVIFEYGFVCEKNNMLQAVFLAHMYWYLA